jgi:hypothetical protein
MRRKAVSLVALVVLTVGSMGFAQAPALAPAAAPVDIYTNFVGTWVGSSRYSKNGAEVTEHIKLEITEEKKQKRLRLDYTYGEKGQQGYDRRTRFITLEPLKEEMTSIFKGDAGPPNKYPTEGLDEFAKTGYGNFIVINQTAQVASGRPALFRGTFHLNADHFNYEWIESLDGQRFTLSSVFRLTKTASAGAAGSAP